VVSTTPPAQQVYVIVDRVTAKVTGPYVSVEPGSGQERVETVGSVVQNDVWYECPFCLLVVDEVVHGVEHTCHHYRA
jgi:hypothetical protein